MPIMILNGRCIEQRSGVTQDGGADWLRSHLRQNGFDPIDIDGRDPAAFAWAIVEMESRLANSTGAVAGGVIGRGHTCAWPMKQSFAACPLPLR